MWAYWLLFLSAAVPAMMRMRPAGAPIHSRRWQLSWMLMLFFLVLLIGLRHRVGADWGAYIAHVEEVAGLSWLEALARGSDPAYVTLNWISSELGGGVYLVNLFAAALFSWGLVSFCRAQPRPWLALAVAVPYLVTVVAMG